MSSRRSASPRNRYSRSRHRRSAAGTGYGAVRTAVPTASAHSDTHASTAPSPPSAPSLPLLTRIRSCVDNSWEGRRLCDGRGDDEVLGTCLQRARGDCSGLSRMELARTVCELLRWRRPNGKLKARECREFLERLDAGGALVLPDKRQGRATGSVTRVPRTAAGEPGRVTLTGRPQAGHFHSGPWGYGARFEHAVTPSATAGAEGSSAAQQARSRLLIEPTGFTAAIRLAKPKASRVPAGHHSLRVFPEERR